MSCRLVLALIVVLLIGRHTPASNHRRAEASHPAVVDAGPAWLSERVSGQLRPVPVAELPGTTALELMLRKLLSSGTLMETTAHPDDEDNALLALFGHGQGMRTVLVSATRGDGGQNEIGQELFQALGVLRTEELLAVHRFDGAEQFFTRAVDFGYSFSVEESIEKWGREAIVGDYVRLIRTIRPDVIVGFLCGGEGGGQHHQASTRLTVDAFRAAGDPSKFPEQMKEGLKPWQATRLFCTERFGVAPKPDAQQKPVTPANIVTVDTSVFDSALGRTYAELGLEARSMHKCQGTSQLLLLPGQTQSRAYRLMESAGNASDGGASMFAGIDTSLTGLTRFAPELSSTLTPALTAISTDVRAARGALASGGPVAAIPSLTSGLNAVRGLRRELASRGQSTDLYEVDVRLAQKEKQFQDALILAAGLRLEALAADGLVVPGQMVGVTAYAGNHAADSVTLRSIQLSSGKPAEVSCGGSIARGRAVACKGDLLIPASAGFTTPYWKPRADAARYDFDPDVPFGVPFTPTPFTAHFELTIGSAEVSTTRPVEYRYDQVLAGEKRMELQVVPAFAVTVSPAIAVIPARTAGHRTIEVSVTNHTVGTAAARVQLRAPSGWRTEPASRPVTFAREDEQVTVSFTLLPPATAAPGEHQVSAVVHSDGVESGVGYEVVEYPHIRRRHVVQRADVRVKVIDVKVATRLRVGYIMGVGDQVPAAIEQLGAEVHLIPPGELAAGDLSGYHTIVTGVRAYERRPDLRANNHRLPAYAAAGGTVLIQYNKFEFNEAQYGPYPAKVSSDRVTDERSTVEVLAPDHPVFARPNQIGPGAWAGWVQERGLYFLGPRDAQYVDLVRLADSYPLNAGPKTGALVEAKVGKGRWIYIGLGLWRQLPAGTDGAYQLMANLISLGARP